MSVLGQIDEIGEAMLLAQEGKLLIARAITKGIVSLYATLTVKLGKLASRSPSIEGWHP